MTYPERVAQYRRLVILRVLADTPGYAANTSLLTDVLNEMGIASSRDQVHTAVTWLAEQALVSAREIAGVCIAQLRDRGVDVAQGRATVPGVKRPSPGGD